MYDESSALAAIDRHTVLVLALCGGALVANLVWFALSIRASRRDSLPACSLLAVLLFLPHDLSYLYRFDSWFGERDHWFPQLFWVGLVVTVGFELLFWRQMWRFGHAELAPFLTHTQFRVALVGLTLVSLVIWEQVKATLDDPLYLGSFTMLIALSPVFGTALLSRRGSAAGQSPGMWGAFSVMAFLWLVGSTLGLGETVRSPLWCGALGIAVAWGGVLAVVLHRLGSPIPERQGATQLVPVPVTNPTTSRP
jgi:hypothetical protein